MTRLSTIVRNVALAAVASVAGWYVMNVPTPVFAQRAGIEVPFGDKVGPAVINYNRLRPNIATGGLLKDGAVPMLKSLGFAAVLDLRGPNEGTDVERKAAEVVGLRYLNIPVTNELPSAEDIAEFGRIVEDAKHYPLMVHCSSASRVGTMWTLYRVQKGFPFSTAVEEGRTIGMQASRESEVRKRLGEFALRR